MKTAIRAAAAVVTLSAASASHAQQAVQWKVSDGGNGHWYQVTLRSDPIWSECLLSARSIGGDLASLTSEPESQFVSDLADATQGSYVGVYGPFVGGFQDTTAQDFSEPGGGWRWSDGSPWSFTYWYPGGEPSNCLGVCGVGCVSENVIQLYNEKYGYYWNDIATVPAPGCRALWISSAFVIEWSADCNNDGIVDKGQILKGQLVDADANGIPDVCEVDPCPGDITNGGTVDAADLSILLAAWGTNGQAEFDTDIDNSGLVDGGDLALVLGGWGPCPQ